MIKHWLANAMVRRTSSRVFPIEDLEKRQEENGSPDFNNSIYFAGIDPGGISIVTRMAFRSDRPNQNLLKIHIPGEGFIGFENNDYKNKDGFRQGPLIFNCMNPGTEWQIIYNGYLDNDLDKELSVCLYWKSNPHILNFGIEGTQQKRMADQLAAKTWNRDFFSKVKGLGKVHYEQAGRIVGSISYKGINYDVDLTGIRDHNYGTRDWNSWNRHMWLVGVLDDGQLFNISSVDYEFIEDLNAGFIGDCWQRRTTLWHSPDVNEAIGEPALPKKLNFEIIEKRGGPKIPCSVKMNQCFSYTMDNNYIIRAASARFMIGDRPGIGIAELGIHKLRYPNVIPNSIPNSIPNLIS